ncbi:MAG: hypothetical protein A2Y63_01720 [Candidatus Riflebacteria bacterium RBG_13_59_9]|nr:MAG: hypothetical protein A2Y63_01720 [Candidatus Riflebacteria bacterium RBG_13_59_9]
MGEGAATQATRERTAFILFTDIHRSTQLWEKFPHDFKTVLEKHNTTVEETVMSHCGEIMKNLGDGYIAIFDSADTCVNSGVKIQGRLGALPPLPDGSDVMVRIVCHAGPLYPLATGRGYFGRSLNRCSRMCQVCHPGQMLISQAVKLFIDELPEGAKAVDLGFHRLRDLGEAEHLYHLDHPEFKLHEFPPLPTLEYRANNLVLQPNEFIGRAHEVEELKKLLINDRKRLVTITAPGGYGKSRLATQLCANLLEHYENGVFEVLLAPIREHTRIVTATANALGFQFYDPSEPTRQLADYLREKQMLLLFDNFEHLTDGKQIIPEILEKASKTSILVTSREPLRLRAEMIYRLDPLPVERRDKAAADELSDAVALFVERASLVKHDFAATEKNLELVQKICRKLDGVPLAIELAAAWSDFFSLPELLSQVERQLELTARTDDIPEKHRSLRASLDWSYSLLQDSERRILRTVSAFQGGFTLDAAKAVVEREDLLLVLAELCDKGWLFTRVTEGQSRFFVRDAATKEYALEKLRQSDEWEETVIAHSRCFARLLEKEGSALGGQGQVKAVRAIGRELENVCEGLDTAVRRDHADLIQPYARYLHEYFVMVGGFQEAAEHYVRILDAAVRLENDPVLLYAHLGLGYVLLHLGRYDDAQRACLAALELAEHLEDLYAVALAKNVLGDVEFYRGNYSTSRSFHNESLSIQRAANDRGGTAYSLHALGYVEFAEGDYSDARSLYREGIAIRREIGDRYGMAQTLNRLGSLEYYAGNYDAARSCHTESLAIRREIGDRYGIAQCLNSLGNVEFCERDYAATREFYEESLAIRQEIGDRFGIAASLNNLGNVEYCEADYDAARSTHLQGLAIKREIGDRNGASFSLNNLGNIAIRQGDFAQAGEWLREALHIAKEINSVIAMVAPLAVSTGLFAAIEDFDTCGILAYGAPLQEKKLGTLFDPMDKGMLDEGIEKLKQSAPAAKLKELKSRAEKMSLDELMDFALEALSEMKA